MLSRIKYEHCPLCDGPLGKPIVTANCSRHALYDPRIPAEMVWMKCDECGHVHTDGYFGDDINEILFSKSHPNQVPGYDMERGRMTAARIVDSVISAGFQNAYWLDDEYWLDVGFGDGALLQTVHEYGLGVVGIDVRDLDVAVKFDGSFNVYRSSLIDFASKSARKFSVVSMADVLEHTPYPKKELQSARKLLLGGALLFISCPNAGSIVWDKLTAEGKNPYWSELEHFHNFSRERLYALLDECGFIPVKFGVSERYRLGMEIIARVK